jgi:hypothetical protein
VINYDTGSSMLYVGHKDIPICVGFYTVSCKLHDKYMITDLHQLSFLLCFNTHNFLVTTPDICTCSPTIILLNINGLGQYHVVDITF